MEFGGNGKSDTHPQILCNHVLNLYSVFGTASIAQDARRGYAAPIAQNKMEIKRNINGDIFYEHSATSVSNESQGCCGAPDINRQQEFN